MNKYFVKYLPVYEELISGDSVKFNLGSDVIHHNVIITDTSIYTSDNKLLFDKAGTIKVKPFICSRDIKINEPFYWRGQLAGNLWTKEYQQDKETNEEFAKVVFKVIGQLSKDAIWVREWDEFKEEDIQLNVIISNTHHVPTTLDKLETDKFLGYKHFIKIKCPICKSFH